MEAAADGVKTPESKATKAKKAVRQRIPADVDCWCCVLLLTRKFRYILICCSGSIYVPQISSGASLGSLVHLLGT